MIFAAKLKIGEVAKITGLSASTISTLEKKGQIRAERSFAGHRLFDLEVLADLAKIYGKRDERDE